MSIKIETVFIKDLFESHDICWELKDVNVLVGKNGLGKSTILQLIKSAVTHEYNHDILNHCEGVQIGFNNNQSNDIVNSIFSPKTITEKIVKTIFNSEAFQSKINNNPKLIKKSSDNKKDANDFFAEKIKESSIANKILNDYINDLIHENPVTLEVEYISTVNMSANSVNNLTKSDGKSVNLLDYEISEELNKLLLSKNSNLNKNNLVSVLNDMFIDSNKKVSFKDNDLLFTLKNGKQINYKSLSSGERQIIYIFAKVINAKKNNALILMDEPEISLHLSWQENLLSQIRKVNKNSQIIIVTHSPAIVMNGWMDSFIDIKNIMVKS